VLRALALSLALVFLCACSGETGPYPSKEIRIIVQSPPGGLSDQISRIMASLIEKGAGV
jgi:tripartite-type tricarboxylate transporter receptor subunit TctC